MPKNKLKNYKITQATIKKHKFIWHFLWGITFFVMFPFVIIQILNNLFEEILNFATFLRERIVYTIFKLLFKKDCRYDGNEDE